MTDIQKETGVGINTLYRWRDEAMNKRGLSATTKYKNADKWSSHDKFIVVLETANLSEIEFSEYCQNKDAEIAEYKQNEVKYLDEINGFLAQIEEYKRIITEKDGEIAGETVRKLA